MKTCRKCGVEKEAECFTRDGSRPDGLWVYCRPCNKEIQAAWYEARYGSTHPLKKLRGKSPIARFEARHVKVPIAGCWLWLTSNHHFGYGSIKNEVGQKEAAHRFAFRSFVSSIPDGMRVLHRCDQPACVNPHHLFLGTDLDNNNDKVAKGRQARGQSLSIAQLKGRERKRHEQV